MCNMCVANGETGEYVTSCFSRVPIYINSEQHCRVILHNVILFKIIAIVMYFLVIFSKYREFVAF